MVNQTRKLMINSLKASIKSMEQQAINAASNSRAINAQTERMGQYFQTITNALTGGQQLKALRQIAPPPSISFTSEDFERVSTTSSQDRVPAEHGRTALSAEFADDDHLEHARLQIRVRKQEELVE